MEENQKLINESIYEIKQLHFFIEHGILSSEQAELEKKLKKLVASREIKVREFLAKKMGRLKSFPKALALRLSKDVHQISKRVIKHYPNFSDDELYQILKHSIDKRAYEAAAKRKKVSEELAFFIIDNASIKAAIEVIKNPHIKLGEVIYIKVFSKYRSEADIKVILNALGKIDQDKLQKAYVYLDENVKRILSKLFDIKISDRPEFSQLNVLNISEHARRKNKTEKEIRMFIDNLYFDNKLHYETIARFLGKGELYSYIYSLSKVTDVPFISVKKIIFDYSDEKAITDLLNDAGFPAVIIPLLINMHATIKQWLVNGKVSESDFNSKLVSYLENITNIDSEFLNIIKTI